MIKAQPGRNESCPCGSGEKYKNCCSRKSEDKNAQEKRPLPLLGILGAILIFFSWGVENIYLSDSGAEVGYLTATQAIINSEQQRHDVWSESLLVHSQLRETSPKAYAAIALKASQTLLRLIAWGEARLHPADSSIPATMMLAKDITIGDQERLFAEGQFGAVIENYETFAKAANSSDEMRVAATRFSNLLKEARDSENNARSWFLRFYIVGGLLSGAQYLLTRRRST